VEEVDAALVREEVVPVREELVSELLVVEPEVDSPSTIENSSSSHVPKLIVLYKSPLRNTRMVRSLYPIELRWSFN